MGVVLRRGLVEAGSAASTLVVATVVSAAAGMVQVVVVVVVVAMRMEWKLWGTMMSLPLWRCARSWVGCGQHSCGSVQLRQA